MISINSQWMHVLKQILAAHDMSWVLNLFNTYGWTVQFLIIFLITIGFSYFEHVVYQRVYTKVLKKKHYWHYGFLKAVHHPLSVLIWLLGITFALDLAGHYQPGILFFKIAPMLRKVGVVVLFTWFLISFVQEIEKIFFSGVEGKFHLDKTTVRAVGQILRVIILATGFFVILQTTLGVGASAILAFAGGGSFIIGWAAKDVLANVFGSFMMFLDRPFAIGDRIRFLDKDIEGYVEYIGWRSTCVRTLEKVPVYIPNSFFSSMSIENPSRMSHRRIHAMLGLRYADSNKMPGVLEEITHMLKQHPDIDQDEVSFAKFVNFGTASLDILVQAFTKATSLELFYAVREDIYFKILNILAKEGVACAVPITEGKLTIALEKESL